VLRKYVDHGTRFYLLLGWFNSDILQEAVNPHTV
jgi:hypothetical protein